MAYKAEDIDIDTFFNLDGQFASPALAQLNKGKGMVTPQFQQPIEKVNTYTPFQTSQTLSGPSHQYELYKQHIPLPPGAITSSLAAARPVQYNDFSQYGMGSNSGIFDMGEEFVDFSSLHRGSTDMDMDFDSPLDTYHSDFLDPSAMGGHEEDSPVPAKAEIVRAYPGMHSAQAQQAALAKQQQQQVEIQKQQQMRQRQQQQAQQPKSAAPKVTNKAPADPVVEERISRLLSQMRQTANVPARQMDEHSPPSMMRSKKDEEDMDEDERLLASEEGKKLSSKERRQLRNKVSARAFRSRRKEYIGQLEGEVAQKSNEADTLRAENEALKAENTRLTDLTKLLLSSSAFSTFLNELSTNGLPASVMAPVTAPAPSVTPQPETRQYTPQPPVNTIVEEDIDFNNLEVNSNWSSGMDMTFAPQVFMVAELPEGPIVDSTFLSGKAPAKETIPVIETAPIVKKVEQPQYARDETVELDEEEFSLFADASTPSPQPSFEFFGSISFEKATETFTLSVDNDDCAGEVSTTTMARFESLNSSLELLSSRLERLICN